MIFDKLKIKFFDDSDRKIAELSEHDIDVMEKKVHSIFDKFR